MGTVSSARYQSLQEGFLAVLMWINSVREAQLSRRESLPYPQAIPSQFLIVSVELIPTGESWEN